jgi:hypothetical protein
MRFVAAAAGCHIMLLLLLQQAGFCNIYNDWRMLSYVGINQQLTVKCQDNPSTYHIRYGERIGYILVEHFVTLPERWR